jgi:phosphoribosylamine-glycine ligase
MRILLVGNGAREHAIAEAIVNGGGELYSFMSAKNPGIAKLSKGHAIGDICDPAAVAKWAKSKGVKMAIVGPEAPLEAGVVDALEKGGIECASPNKSAARLETDKAFTRNLLKKHNVPGAPIFRVLDNAKDIDAFLDSTDMEVAVKPAGLTGGKGVKMQGEHLKDKEAVRAYAKEIVEKGVGTISKVVIEEKLVGEEFTLQAFVSPGEILGMPMVQDHKRAYDGDVGPNCYSEDTEILTDDGWKKFDKLLPKNKVAVFDPESKEIRFERPKERHWMKHSGQMIHFGQRNLDLLVTPNHRMLVQQRRGKNTIRVMEARDYAGENYIFQTGIWKGENEKFFVLPEYNYNFNRKHKEKKVDFMDWARFLGIYLSEGYITDNKGSSGARAYICQVRKSRNFSAIQRILSKMPFDFKYEENNNKFRVNSVQLTEHLKRFGISHEKYVPDYIKNAGKDAIKAFVEAFALGDGDIRLGKTRLCSGSKRMIDDLQELILKMGHTGVITVDKRTTMTNPLNKKTYPARPVYAIGIKDRTKTSVRKYNLSKVRYDGWVGCVTVSTGFVVVRRNNRVAISGNTGGMGSYTGRGYILPFLTREDYDFGLNVMRQAVKALKEETGAAYKGPLYGQFIVTQNGPKLIEFNARFGDPEAMNVLNLFQGNFVDAMKAMVRGGLGKLNIEFADKATVCKYLVPEGYPEKPQKGAEITVDEAEVKKAGARVYYASVGDEGGRVITSGSRAVAVIAAGDSIGAAEKMAERATRFVKGPLRHRRDIGTEDLIQKRVKNMQAIRG